MKTLRRAIGLTVAAALAVSGFQLTARPPAPAAGLIDGNQGDDWSAYGRTYGEQHYSPLSAISTANVAKLGLAWSYDLPAGNPVSGPISVGGVLYTATGYSIVRAFDATNGKELWSYDPRAGEAAGPKLREGWGIRGLAWWNGKIYVGTQDGRLIALNAKSGKPVWSALTVSKDDFRFISGPPRVFDGKVIIGHGGADAADTRGYVTTYDAETGKQLWRFYTVPGNPAVDKDETTRLAAKTWKGEWWKYGGGGTVFNTMTYDKDTDTVLLGTGNGAPWNHKVRSLGEGDNWFLCSVVALDAKTGKYKWHYQTNPAETWDYNSAMDMQLAELEIDGKPRKVVLHAPKNGFLYVIDRTNGKLISAEKIAHVTWADRIDIATGRPVENPKARFPEDEPFSLFPGPMGAHTWLPSAFSPKTGLIYLPITESGLRYDSKGFKPGWQRPPDNSLNGAYNFDFDYDFTKDEGAPRPSSLLLAWNPATQHGVWRVPTSGIWSGGVLATAGGLVFQGQTNGQFVAYDAATGQALWKFDAQAAVLAPPITYRVKGVQYVTVLAGMGTSAGLVQHNETPIDYRTQARRILTFKLGGSGLKLPRAEPFKLVAFDDPDFSEDKESAARGGAIFARNCTVCHGNFAIAQGSAPDLRASPIPASAEAFRSVIHDGALVANGMPVWPEFSDADLADIRQYLRTQAAALRQNGS
jgi:quinohemoprotein ethanol dehydrogenase